MNTKRFNSYIDSPAVKFWKELCLKEGTPIHYNRGDYFFREGEVAPYFGYIRSGTLKYTAYGDEGEEYILGLEFSDGFVSDFPFSLHGLPARTSVIATSPCEILCVSTRLLQERLASDSHLMAIVLESTEAVFGTVYDRYKDIYIKSPQLRYNELVTQYPDLFALFSLRDIASFLRITPTHLSRLRKNI